MTKTLEIFMDEKIPEKYFPKYESEGAAGFDLCAWIPQAMRVIARGETLVLNTGLYFMIPEGYEVQIRSRSGLAAKHGISVLNSPGTIDSDYRGEICIILQNNGPDDYLVCTGDRCAQAVFKKARQAKLKRVTSMRLDTKRGDKGFGSTGK